MKLKHYALLIGLIATVSYISYTLVAWHKQDQIIPHMVATCEQSYKVIDGKLEEQCGQLIDEVQANGFEVLSKDGKFWAEYNPTANQ